MKLASLSLIARLTISISIVVVIVLLSFGWLIERSIQQHFIKQDSNEINTAYQAIQHALLTLPDKQTDTVRHVLGNAVLGHDIQYAILDTHNKIVYSTFNQDIQDFVKSAKPVNKLSSESLQTWQHQTEVYRGVALPLQANDLQSLDFLKIVLGKEINFHLHFLAEFHHYLRLLTLAACLIALLFILIVVYQGHAPLRKMSQEIKSISSNQLHVRLNIESLPKELVNLATSFNDLLSRLEDVFKRLSSFSGDIAHELRTPITNLKTQTEVALSQARSLEEYREVLYSNLEEYERMAKMVADMLFLAQADNHLLKPELTRVNLLIEIENLFDYFSAWAEEQDIKLIVKGEPVSINGDRLMLRRALSNLLSNAIRHTPAHESITVNINHNTQERKCTIRISNPGETIPAEHLPYLFDRFYRTDSSRQRSSEGAGLGLAITQSIIQAHGGQIQVYSNQRLTSFEIFFPL